MKIRLLAQHLIKKLKEEGFIIHYYESYSTNSIYLKLDYGVCNSIRISDHAGKRKLKYRFNVILGTHGRIEIDEGFERRYYNEKHINALIQDILKVREDKRKEYGNLYGEIVQMNRLRNIGKKGFWEKAQLV